jgi:hypothetical protein
MPRPAAPVVARVFDAGGCSGVNARWSVEKATQLTPIDGGLPVPFFFEHALCL